MKQKYLILFSLSGLVLCCDQITKLFVHSTFQVNEAITVIPSFLSFVYTRNNGFAFGLLQKAPPSLQEVFFIGVPVFALILIVLIFIKLRDNQILTSVALTTILAGAVGNLIDRLQHGFVIDFMDFHFQNRLHFPPFNIADCSIIIGVLIMFVNTLMLDKNKALPAEKA